METTVLEREDPIEATPAPKEVKVAEPTQPEVQAEPETAGEQQPVETAKEAEFELEGQRYTASQLKEALEAAKNKAEWQKSNTLKAQEISRQRKEVEEAIALQNLLKQNPEKLQKLFAPEPERDFDGEMKAHYAQRPSEFDERYVAWEMKRDALIREQASAQAFKQAHAQEVQRAAQQHNESLANQAYERYKGKVSDPEYQEMAAWLVNNIQPKNGKYPENSFDVAYKVLYGERDVEAAKLSASKAAADQMRKAKPASGEQGKLPTPEKKTPEDDEDEAFAQAVKDRYKSAR